MWRRSLYGAVNQPFAAAGAAFSLAWVGDNTSGTDASAYTFTAEPIGTASAGRRVLFGVAGRTTGTAPTLSATLAGNAATELATVALDGGSGRNKLSIFYRDEPSGTTADIVATFSQTMLRAAVDVANVENFNGAPSTDAQSTLAGTTRTISLTVPTGGKGYVFAYGTNTTSLSISGTGVTQNAQQAMEFGFSRSAILDTAGSITVTVTGGASGDILVAGVAYGP